MCNIVHFSSIILLLLAVVVVSSSAQSCKATPADGCPCMQRSTFDQQWLVDTYPAVAAKFSAAYTFQAPVVTYPECAAIIVTCPNGTGVATFTFKNQSLTIGNWRFQNPTIISSLICDDGNWYKSGLSTSVDENLKSSTLSCAIPN
ncbi:unnamed protein product [Caenorhabditis sp. 36 PRJEB53466]|nr:unnamed protein product [Caenorhabditis sp. 36 PRJEB53466]